MSRAYRGAKIALIYKWKHGHALIPSGELTMKRLQVDAKIVKFVQNDLLSDMAHYALKPSYFDFLKADTVSSCHDFMTPSYVKSFRRREVKPASEAYLR